MVEGSGIGGAQGVSIANEDGNASLGNALRTLVDAKKSCNHDNENNRLAALSGDIKTVTTQSDQNSNKSSDITAQGFRNVSSGGREPSVNATV